MVILVSTLPKTVGEDVLIYSYYLYVPTIVGEDDCVVIFVQVLLLRTYIAFIAVTLAV